MLVIPAPGGIAPVARLPAWSLVCRPESDCWGSSVLGTFALLLFVLIGGGCSALRRRVLPGPDLFCCEHFRSGVQSTRFALVHCGWSLGMHSCTRRPVLVCPSSPARRRRMDTQTFLLRCGRSVGMHCSTWRFLFLSPSRLGSFMSSDGSKSMHGAQNKNIYRYIYIYVHTPLPLID